MLVFSWATPLLVLCAGEDAVFGTKQGVSGALEDAALSSSADDAITTAVAASQLMRCSQPQNAQGSLLYGMQCEINFACTTKSISVGKTYLPDIDYVRAELSRDANGLVAEEMQRQFAAMPKRPEPVDTLVSVTG